MKTFELIKPAPLKKNVMDQIEELNILRNKGFLLLTEKERERYNELVNTLEKKVVNG